MSEIVIILENNDTGYWTESETSNVLSCPEDESTQGDENEDDKLTLSDENAQYNECPDFIAGYLIIMYLLMVSFLLSFVIFFLVSEGKMLTS